MVQPNAIVGPTAPPYKPQIVSIRAGQGPSDQQVPLVPPKTPAPDIASGKYYGIQQDWNSRIPLAPGPAQSSYLQVPHEAYGSARASSSAPVQNGLLHSQPNSVPHPSTATQASHTLVQPPAPSHPGHYHTDPIARAPSTAPIPPVKPSPTVAPTHSSPLPPLPTKSHSAPSPRRQIHSLPALPKGETSLTIPQKGDLQVPPSAPPVASFAKLNVYRAPDPPVSGELSFHPPTSSSAAHVAQHAVPSQNHQPHVPAASAQELSSRFPLNEDHVNSAATRAVYATTAHGSARSATFPPVHANYVPSLNATPPSPMQSSSQRPHPQPGEDTPRAAPIPIPEPRSMIAMAQAQVASTAAPPMTNQPFDPRSPKAALTTPAPILSSSPFQSAHHPSPLQSAPATLTQFPSSVTGPPGANGANHSPANSIQHPPSTPAPNYASHSPSRSIQLNIARHSPAAAASALTPKHSPSGRMHLRNGSSDTISQAAVAKHSPSSSKEKNLAQRTSISNIQQPYAPSRQDTTTPYPRQPLQATSNPGYPESVRYRSSTMPQPQSQPQPQAPYSAQHASVSIPATQSHPGYQNTTNGAYPSARPALQPTAPPVTSQSTPQYDLTAVHRIQPQPPPSTQASVGQSMSSASAIAAAYRNGTYHSEFASRPPDPSRVPPRTAPSPAPTGAGRQYPSVTSATRAQLAGSIATPQPVRGQTAPASSNGRPATAAPITSHSRSASDPHFGTAQPPASRVPVSGPPSTPAAPKHALESLRISSSPVEPEQLRTPSSLAPSMSRHNSFAPSIPPSITPSKERESRFRGFFGRFRSKSSPPKQAEVKPPPSIIAKPAPSAQPRPRASSQSTMQAVAASVKNIVTPHPTNIHMPTPIVAPTPTVPANSNAAVGDHKIPGSNPYTVFRLISKRNRTVSAASVEAMDGTAVSLQFCVLWLSLTDKQSQPNTVIGVESVRSSTAGRPSPPLRDPVIATSDWRNREEAGQLAKGTMRRHRPGVTFDFVEDVIDEMSSVKPVRRSSRRYDTK